MWRTLYKGTINSITHLRVYPFMRRGAVAPQKQWGEKKEKKKMSLSLSLGKIDNSS